MIDENKLKQTIRELLEVGGLLKTGEFETTFRDETSDTEWVGVDIAIKPKKTTWNAALDRLPPQKPLIHRLLECMSGKDKVELFRLLYVEIKRWAEPDSALPDDYREKLTAICEDTLEALSRAPKKSQEKEEVMNARAEETINQAAPWLMDPKEMDLSERIMMGRRHGGKNILVTISEAEDMQTIRRIRQELGELLGIEYPPLWDQIIEAVKEIVNEPDRLLLRVQEVCGFGANTSWDEVIESIRKLNQRSGARGKRLFELRRAVVAIMSKYHELNMEYIERESQIEELDSQERHDQEYLHGVLVGLLKAHTILNNADPPRKDAPKDNRRIARRYCTGCNKVMYIRPPKEDVELPVPDKVLCESCSFVKKREEARRLQRPEDMEDKIPDIEAMLTRLYLCVVDIGNAMGAPINEGSNIQKHLKQLDKTALDLGLDLEEE